MSETNKNKIVEIWIRGRKLCEVPADNEALEFFEQIVKKSEYSVSEREEGNKIIKIV